jgi:hypothetical protein
MITDASHVQARSSRPPASRRQVGLGALVAAMFALALLVPDSSFALSEGRVYEMVSPVYKAGYRAGLSYVAPDGETVVFQSVGSFAGDPNDDAVLNYYVAHRGGSGWSTDSVSPPATLLPKFEEFDFSPTLSTSLVAQAKLGPNSGYADSESQEGEFRLHDTALPDEGANFALAGEVLKPLTPTSGSFLLGYHDASPDFSHIIFSESSGEEKYLLPEAAGSLSRLYDLSSAGAAGDLGLVGLDNQREVIYPDRCEPELGNGGIRDSQYNAVSSDGEEIFFSVGLVAGRSGAAASATACGEHAQLFMRVGGERTVEVSRPLDASTPYGGCVGEVGEAPGEVPCKGAVSRPSAEFQGASENGDRVFFTTSASLLPGSTSNNLYMATIGCPGGGEACEPSQREVTGLVQASSGLEPAEVQNVIAVAPDGSHMYFVARGVLNADANSEGAVPLKGADNLYVYDSSSAGAPVFIGDLCSGPEESGVVQDVQCPAGLTTGKSGRNDTLMWLESKKHEAQVNDCVEPEASCETGRFLLFSAYAQLAASDTDTAKDVYRYDALTGVLDRVSVGEAGSSENGNGDLFDATIPRTTERNGVAVQHDLDSRAITQNGSRVVFSSAEPLSPAATEGVVNAYEWHRMPGQSEGSVSLVSPGSSPVEQVVISSSGRDVFFETAQGLIPQDTDGLADVYDARIGGGFPQSPVEPESCAGDACRGPLTNPAPLLVPGSVSQAPGGNFAAPTKVVVVSKPKKKPKPKKKVKPKGKRKRAKRARRDADAARGRGRR